MDWEICAHLGRLPSRNRHPPACYGRIKWRAVTSWLASIFETTHNIIYQEFTFSLLLWCQTYKRVLTKELWFCNHLLPVSLVGYEWNAIHNLPVGYEINSYPVFFFIVRTALDMPSGHVTGKFLFCRRQIFLVRTRQNCLFLTQAASLRRYYPTLFLTCPEKSCGNHSSWEEKGRSLFGAPTKNTIQIRCSQGDKARDSVDIKS